MERHIGFGESVKRSVIGAVRGTGEVVDAVTDHATI